MGKPHRATGNPRGRPPKIPFDFGLRIMENLRQRVDPKTGLVRPRWKQMARELGVSRSTIARQMAELYASGAYERISRLTLYCNCPNGTWNYETYLGNHLRQTFGFPSFAEIVAADAVDRVLIMMRVAGHECCGVFFIDPPHRKWCRCGRS